MKQYKINNKIYLYDNRNMQSVNNRTDKYLIINELTEEVIEGWPTYKQATHFCQVLRDHDDRYARRHNYKVVDNPEYK